MRIWTEADVRAGVGLPEVIDSLTEVLAHEAEGTAWNLDKTMATWPLRDGTADATGSAHALGAVDLVSDLAVFKTWVNTPAGASAVLTLFGASDGRTLGVAEAGAAGSLRTSAISGVATRLLADPAADEVAVLGAGRQAFMQVAAIAAVRPLRRVRVWNRTVAKAEDLAERIRTELGVDAHAVSSLGDAIQDCPIVTLVTRAAEPFLDLSDLADGAHVNAVGAILPTHAELVPGSLAVSSLTVVDSEPNARRASRELREFDGWAGVRTLGEVVTGKIARPARPRLTVFKGLGMGLSDLAVARVLVGGGR
ncbi:ornithine cyclodeaminase family protein [Pseudonocardia kujensis]|uniref:ornithine cyclodeaminase family protein n=1 Tax=Pseudonocardia kujensis TaxID=1128675 RepID=UPI001E2AC39C|nr:ornithine cyclodeaminase family protein [Pseudonocardia kujensis]MCE0765545.1 ornithine cyclodeaminase family protein [Pseudonocardia kujensis]